MGTEWYRVDKVWAQNGTLWYILIQYGYIMVRYGNSMVHGWGILSMVQGEGQTPVKV